VKILEQNKIFKRGLIQLFRKQGRHVNSQTLASIVLA